MIHYSSINDAWGNKETFKNNKPPSDNKPEPELKHEPKFEPKVESKIEHFSCNSIEHLNNCSSCKAKMKELFNNSTNSNKTIELFGCKINLSNNFSQCLLKIILILLLLLLIINLVFLFKNNNSRYYIPNNINTGDWLLNPPPPRPY
jgi:hypothetical protein